MKNTLKLSGFVTVAAVISLLLLSCPKDEAQGGVSLPSSLNIADAPAFPEGAQPPATLAEARSLLSAISNYSSTGSLSTVLGTAYDAAFDKAFTAKYSVANLQAYALSKSTENGLDVDISIDDTIPFAAGTESGITIKGNTYGKVNLTGPNVGQFLAMANQGSGSNAVLYTENGQGVSSETSGNMTFTFPLVDVKGSTYSSNNYDYKVGGVLYVEFRNNSSETLTDKDLKVFSSENNNETKYSLVLTVYHTSPDNVAAKFRMSYASSGSGSTRAVSSSGYTEYSDLVIYDKDGKELYTEAGSSFTPATNLIQKIRLGL